MIRRVAAIACALAVVLLLLEATARVYLFGAAGLDPRKVQSLRDFRETEFVRESTSPRIGFEHVENASGYFKLVPYATNSVGLRDGEYALEKPPGTFRVVVIGSSFTVPAGVRIEEAYHSVMEEELSRARAPLRFEFLNFAVGAMHPRQQLALLRERALAYDPDLILFGTTPLSMPLMHARPTRPKGAAPYRLKERTHPFWNSFLIDLIELRTGRLDPELSVPFKEPKGRTILTTLGQISRETGVPIVVLRLEFDAERAPAGEREMERAARAAGLYFFDTRAHFRGLDARKMWIHPMDPHPDGAAHAIFAGAITAFLDENGLLPGADGPRATRN